jgi:hypothetical protein
LYVDGEMPLKSMQDRLKLLEPNPAEELYLMSHDDLAEEEIIAAGNGGAIEAAG